MGRKPIQRGRAGRVNVTKLAEKKFEARCRYRDWTGGYVQVSRQGPSRTAAERNLQDAIAAMSGARGKLTAEDTFERAAQLWLERYETAVANELRSPTTLDLYRGQLQRIVLPVLGQLRLSECTPGEIDMFFTGLASRRTRAGDLLSAKYRRSIRDVVKQIFDRAVLHGAVPTNPTAFVEKIEERRGRQPRALTPEERRRLFAWLNGTSDDPATARAQEAARRHDLPDLLTLMVGTGLRIGEVLGLRWRDVDLEGVPMSTADGGMVLQPIVAVTGNIVRVRGKGLVRNAGKTEKALRIVPLPRFVASMLVARRPEVVDPEWPVFATVGKQGRGVTWRDPGNVSGDILAMRRAMGVEWKLTSHTFRKTAATIWHDSGVLTDRQKADLTGHAKISTLTDIYVARGELHPEGAAVMDAAWVDS